MATFSTEATFAVGDTGVTVDESVTVNVTGPVTAPNGTGRLIHPTLGTYDYDIAPDEWGNVDADIIAPPIWSHSLTLTGAASAKWAGTIQDLEVYERWTGRLAVAAGQLRMFVDMWQAPPDKPNYLRWSPNYINNNTYNVQLVALSCGGQAGVNVDFTILQGRGFVKGPLEMTYRIVSKV